MKQYWYQIREIPDLTLNKYASLEDSGVEGVLEKHIAFLRQLNRKGILSDLSFHLFYFFVFPENKEKDMPGQRIQLFFMVQSTNDYVENIPALVEASPLSKFFSFEKELNNGQEVSIDNYLKMRDIKIPQYKCCSILTKTETLLPSDSMDLEDYYLLRDWEVNDSGRLYNMFNMMDAIKKTALYRVDLYPVERSEALRKSLRSPMNYLRKKQDERSSTGKRDYDGKDVLDNYSKLIEKFDSSPHFISNIMVFADEKENSTSILDAAGAESLIKGKYSVSTFNGNFNHLSFLSEESLFLESVREKMVAKSSRKGLVVCREDTSSINLNYLPTMFTLEEIAPFFRFPALYDGEIIQIPKETAPLSVEGKDALFLGKDKNGYDINFPLKLLPKHAFISGVPGSGKTNTMHHITSSLWKDHRIPFLVLEPAKQEYRALANDPEMSAMYLFSPNADMSFPLHINPFEMPRGIMVAEHIRRLCSVFEGAFPLEPPMPFLLDTAIEAVYRELGWIPEHIYTGDEREKDGETRRKLPTMSMLYRRLEKELKTTKYSDEVRGNLESALQVRIGSLLRREMGDVFDVPKSTFTPEKWLEVPAVIELESMGTGPANFLNLMLCSLIRETLKVDPNRTNITQKVYLNNSNSYLFRKNGFEFVVKEKKIDELVSGNQTLSVKSEDGKAKLIMTEDTKYRISEQNGALVEAGYFDYHKSDCVLSFTLGNRDVRHIIFIEEAHNLIGPESEEQAGADADPKQAATAFVVKMLAEVRALKEGIVIADQLPTVMAQEVLKNTGLKIALRITSADDRNLLGSTMAASPMQLEQMATYSVGEALIFYEKLRKPFNMRIKEWWGELKDEKEKDNMVTSKNDIDLRVAMRNHPTYSDENKQSIEIIGEKYLRLFSGIKDEAAPAINLYNSLINITKRLKTYDSQFLKIEKGEVSISDEEKVKLYDEHLVIVRLLAEKLSAKADLDSPFESVKKLINWIFALERLKNGRWKTCGASERDIARITLLQSMMVDKCLDIYFVIDKASNSSKDINRALKNRIAEISDAIKDVKEIKEKSDTLLSDYVQRNGEKSLLKHQ